MNSMTTYVSTHPANPRDTQQPLRFDEICTLLSFFSVFATVAIGYFHAYHQMRDKSKRMENRLITRIIFAAPIYSMYSLVVTLNDSSNDYMYLIRDCYGAYVIYGFVALCYVYIGGEENVIERKTVSTLRFYERTSLQYCFVKPFLACVAAFLQLFKFKYYKDGDWSMNSSYIYITAITTFSATLATYGLFSFLKTARGMMKTGNLVLKFVIVTFIVFGTYWQGVLLALFEETITCEVSTDPGTVAARYQNWLVCAEMLPTAIAVRCAFPIPFSALANNDELTVEYGAKRTSTPSDPEIVIVFKSSNDSLYPLLV